MDAAARAHQHMAAAYSSRQMAHHQRMLAFLLPPAIPTTSVDTISYPFFEPTSAHALPLLGDGGPITPADGIALALKTEEGRSSTSSFTSPRSVDLVSPSLCQTFASPFDYESPHPIIHDQTYGFGDAAKSVEQPRFRPHALDLSFPQPWSPAGPSNGILPYSATTATWAEGTVEQKPYPLMTAQDERHDSPQQHVAPLSYQAGIIAPRPLSADSIPFDGHFGYGARAVYSPVEQLPPSASSSINPVFLHDQGYSIDDTDQPLVDLADDLIDPYEPPLSSVADIESPSLRPAPSIVSPSLPTHRRASDTSYGGLDTPKARERAKRRKRSWTPDMLREGPNVSEEQKRRELEQLAAMEASGGSSRKEKRRIQNRLAQRAFRARSKVNTKEAASHMEDLQALAGNQADELVAMADRLARLGRENDELKGRRAAPSRRH